MNLFRRFAFAAIAGVLLLAGCAGDDAVGIKCPQIRIPQDTERLTRFREGGGRDITDVTVQAGLRFLSGECEIDEDSIVMKFPVAVGAERGPADKDGVANVTLFTAVTTREREILSRREIPISIAFPGNRTRIVARENLTIEIPKTPEQTSKDFLVFLGIKLSHAELEFNRNERRTR